MTLAVLYPCPILLQADGQASNPGAPFVRPPQASSALSAGRIGVAASALAHRLESLLSTTLVEPVQFPPTEEGFVNQVRREGAEN